MLFSAIGAGREKTGMLYAIPQDRPIWFVSITRKSLRPSAFRLGDIKKSRYPSEADHIAR